MQAMHGLQHTFWAAEEFSCLISRHFLEINPWIYDLPILCSVQTAKLRERGGHFPIANLGKWLWRYRCYVLKFNTRNVTHTRATAPIFGCWRIIYSTLPYTIGIYMQLYMSWYIRSFFGFTFLNILYFFKYSCTKIFHRRSLYTL